RAECQRYEHEHADGGAGGDGARLHGRLARACQPGNRHHDRQRKCQCERELADFSGQVPPSFQRPERFSASTTSGGMYFSSCLARTSVASNVPVPFSAPIATMPCPSRNRSGSTPWNSTGTAARPSVTTKRTSACAPWLTLPFSTNPPMRNATPGDTCF